MRITVLVVSCVLVYKVKYRAWKCTSDAHYFAIQRAVLMRASLGLSAATTVSKLKNLMLLAE